MNLKHGFFSAAQDINPDSRMVQSEDIPRDELVVAERFLHGDSGIDPVRAHNAIKRIHAAGRLKYPTLWELSAKHINGYEFATLDALSKLTS